MSTAIEDFESMVHQSPHNALARYMLANEYIKASLYEKAVEQLNAYLQLQEDEGAAYRMLAQSLEKLGRIDEARQAYEKGIEQAMKHGHPGMADEFRQALEELEA
jgi:predicted Zn-dependent protease